MRRTKIVVTLGPDTREPDALRALLEAGADVVRLNFAHATVEEHKRAAATARRQAKDLGRVVGVLVDLPGPKMRTGSIVDNEVRLEPDQPFILTAPSEFEGDVTRVSTTVDDLPSMVGEADEIFLADGEIVLRVDKVDSGEVHTTVVRGGVLRSRKGLHLPQAERRVEAFTADDEIALGHALAMEADLVGLSFVRDVDDIRRCKAALPKRGHRPLIVAKIETRSALDHLGEIVEEADVVMVARGDLGIQMPLRRVPLLQKEIIRVCNEVGVPAITATELLSSMTHSPLPTRAEVTDVANALLDGTDAVMLSEETAVGHYPTLAVRQMAEIAEAAESWPRDHAPPERRGTRDDRVSWAVAHAAVEAAEDLNVAAILCPTRSGATARRVAAFRPRMPILALSPRQNTLGSVTIYWGVTALPMREVSGEEARHEEVSVAVTTARDAGLVRDGQLVCVVAGAPGPRAGGTDYVRIVRV
ncbi:MAG TPA: pyruvate kinase [Acidimicrobiia bacterium]|nr:pyruvate kinase [Acidimicrobiia bacterium]